MPSATAVRRTDRGRGRPVVAAPRREARPYAAARRLADTDITRLHLTALSDLVRAVPGAGRTLRC